MPFKVQEVQDKGGIYFGENAISHNLIMCNKANLLNQSAFLLGVPGSGKSFSAKELIAFPILSTADDVLICDPENEFGALAAALGKETATVIHMAAGGKDRLNAMYMVDGYGENNPIVEKSQFIMSLVEQIDKAGVGPQQKSIHRPLHGAGVSGRHVVYSFSYVLLRLKVYLANTTAAPTDPNTKVINLTTYRNMSSDLADETIIFKPNGDLAIANYLIREIISRGAVDEDFVSKHTIFTAGVTDIGYGLRNTDKYAYPAERDILEKQKRIRLSPAEATAMGLKAGTEVEQKNSGGSAGAHWQIEFEEFRKAVEPYTLDFVAPLVKGDDDETLESFKARLVRLADLVCDRKRDLLSFWCMGFNQHQRGVWANELVYSIHLLMGKHAKPGNGAFSLTGQPSACGSAREVGTFCHRLPSDMLVANGEHRKKTESIWNLPAGTLNPKVGYSVMEIMRGLEDGSVNFMWTQVVNILQSTPNNTHWVRAARDPKNFVVVSDVYPTYSARAADLILPAAMHFEKWGLYGNAERRTQGWHQLVKAPGEAKTDIWMMMEFARRFTVDELYRAQPLKGVPGDALPDVREAAAAMGLKGDATLFDVLFAPSAARQAAWPDPLYKKELNATGEALGLPYFPEKALFGEYRQFTLGNGHDLADFDTYMREDVRGLLWPVVNGRETLYRFNVEYDPYAKPDNLFYGKLMKPVGKGTRHALTDKNAVAHPGTAKIFFRPYMDPVEMPDANYDLWLCTGRILEHWHTGSMTRRVPELDRAAPRAVLYMNPADAERRGIRRGDTATVTSRHGECKAVVETKVRNIMPRGMTWLAFFDDKVLCNSVVIDAMDPISLEPDFKKTAVKVVRDI